MDKEYLKKLSLDIKIDLTDDEIEELKTDFEILNNQLDLLNKINTDDVEPMVYPFEQDTYYLRDDVVENVIRQEDALANTVNKKEGHFVVNKVVK